MVESVANVFLETLRDLLVEETKFLLSVSGKVEQVKRDLRSIHALLMKADRCEIRDSPTLKNHVMQLKDLAFEAENLLEAYTVKVESKKGGRRSLKDKFHRYICIICECCSVHEIGKDTEDIILRLADLTKSLESEFGQQSLSLSSHEEYLLLRQTYAHEIEPHFVGMERDIEVLVSMVKDETRRRRVIKIYGMGGLGKTTLARKVYNHEDVKFYARAWVCVTQQFQARAVFSKILKQFDDDKERIDRMDVDELVVGIHSFLEKRKCLIVIDDIWENDHWEIIKKAFPMNCNVLLTTRDENIANQESHPHKLEFLTEDQGWELLHKIALPQDFAPVAVEAGFKSLEDIGRQIVVKCGRLPLSISVIGGILRQKEECSLAEWKKVNMNIDSYLSHGGEGVAQYTRVKQVLDLSYDALPYYLKPCFLYLACFPEDEEIDPERLYLLWMAEGFISYEDKGRNESLRDVAERYLSELAMRCMVQVLHEDGKFESCRLHDLMHELCSSKVEEEKLLRRIEISNYVNDIPSSSGNSSNRLAIPSSSIGNSMSRLAITTEVRTNKISIGGLEEAKDLRSFLLLGKHGIGWINFHLEKSAINFERLPCLRILVLEGCCFEGDKLPSKVGKLIHLRYLSLKSSFVRELPQSVCVMQFLHTLDLRISGVIKLPNVIWKMKRLKHLFLLEIEVIGGDKLILDGLEDLETLQDISSETARIEDISKLISLQRLRVKVSDVDSLSTFVSNMSTNRSRSCEIHLHVESCDLGLENVFENLLMSPSLVSLCVSSCNVRGGFACYRKGMCENLLHLEISNTVIAGDAMKELGKYPMLQTLELRRGSIMGETGKIFRSCSFPELKSLSFMSFNLENWEVEEGAMPKLTKLLIYNCFGLEKVPDGLRFISTLQQLKIIGMPKEFNDRVRGQDYASIAHIEHEVEFSLNGFTF